MKEIGLGICGFGTVGSGVFTLLANNAERISAQIGVPIKVIKIGSRSYANLASESNIPFSRDVFSLVDDPKIDIILELMGGIDTAFDLIKKSILNGKHVVTANKALIATHGRELFSLAEKQSTALRFEASVAGCIPVVKVLRESLSCNEISMVAGIINGTTNYILSEMEISDRPFGDVLAEAQELGFAEADPSFDIEGVDAGHKLVILASLAFGVSLSLDGLYTDGISQITSVDLLCAKELGYRIKHVAVAKIRNNKLELHVQLALIPQSHLMSHVNGVKNAVYIKGDPSGETLLYGAGAGAGPTASSVIGDVIDLSRNMVEGFPDQVKPLGFQMSAIKDLEFASPDEIIASWYMRIEIENRKEVMSSIEYMLADKDIDIEILIQKPLKKVSEEARVLIITKPLKASSVELVARDLVSLDGVKSGITKIRVADLS